MPCGALDWILNKKRTSVGKLGTLKLTLQSGTLSGLHTLLGRDLLGLEPRSHVSRICRRVLCHQSYLRSPQTVVQLKVIYQAHFISFDHCTNGKCQMLTLGKLRQRIYMTCLYYDCHFSKIKHQFKIKFHLKIYVIRKIFLSIKT